MRTENDLMAALRTLEPSAPDDGAVLRGVLRRVARRRIRRAASLTGASALAAAVTAAAVVTGPARGPAIGGGHPSPGPKRSTVRVQTAAYIVEHAADAEADASRMIQVIRDRAGVDYLSVATQQTLFVSSQRTVHGRPLMASAENIKGTTYTATLVDYKDRAYTVTSASTLNAGPWGAKGIVIGSWLAGVQASSPASAYRAALRKGIINVLGYRMLNGRRTILIRLDFPTVKVRIPKPRPCRAGQAGPCLTPGLSHRPAACKLPPPPINEVWLDASTYLEVQSATIEPKTVMHLLREKHITWGCYTVVGWTTSTTSVGWLRPTKRNLVRLHLTPPAGFTEVSMQQMARYLGPYS
jgi:hypothetical protein